MINRHAIRHAAFPFAVLAGVAAGLASFGASAQTATAPQAAAPAGTTAPAAAPSGNRGDGGVRIGQVCKLDIATHCATAEKGRGGRMKCLSDNKAKLAPDCAAALDTIASGRQARQASCRTEIQTLCGDARGPARRACVETNASKLSAECSQRLAKHAERRADKATPVPASPAPAPKQQ